QQLVRVARYGLLFPAEGRRPRRLLLACRDEWDPACGCGVFTEDLNYDAWIRAPQSVVRVSRFPGTLCHFANGYDIVHASSGAAGASSVPPNQVLLNLFSIEWPGSLLVVKTARRDAHAIHITTSELSVVNAIVERYARSGSQSDMVTSGLMMSTSRWLQIKTALIVDE
ncbi:hypothetical protein OH77DRAFT_1570606, partial [Trametes cingulata]